MFAKIEIEKGGGVTLNPSFSFQPDRRLIDALPGLSRETLAKAVVGELLTQIDCPGSYLHVLYNLICHAGWHSNRAWVSLPRLASLTSRISKCSAKTAQRAMEFWCRTIGIRKITDQTELLSGPGEHQFVDAGGKKRGEGAVNHYDMSAVLSLIPAELTALADALISGGQIHVLPLPPALPPVDLDAAYPDPFTEPEASASSPYLSPESSLIQTPHRVSARRAPAPEVCSVGKIDTEAGEGKTSKTENAPEKFTRTNLSSITKTNAPARETISRPRKPVHDLPIFKRLTLPKADGGRGFEAAGAARLIRERGIVFVTDLIEYALWQEAQGAPWRGPGYLTNTARDWPGAWPKPFAAHMKRQREESRRERAETSEANNAAARNVYAAPKIKTEVTLTENERAAQEIAQLEALPPDRLLAVEAAARAHLAKHPFQRRFADADWRTTQGQFVRAAMIAALDAEKAEDAKNIS